MARWSTATKGHALQRSPHPTTLRSQINDARVVVEELATVLGYLHGDAIWIFNALLAEFFQYTAETVVPRLLLLGCFARIRRAELNKQSLTYKQVQVSLRTMEGRYERGRGRLSIRTIDTHAPEVLVWALGVIARATCSLVLAERPLRVDLMAERVRQKATRDVLHKVFVVAV